MSATPDPRSGLDGDGVWEPAFPGQRPPFQPGHELTVKHGAYAVVRLAPRAREIASALRDLVPNYSPSDQPTIEDLAICKAQIEAAQAALAQVYAASPERPLATYLGKAGDEIARLRADLQGWLTRSRRLQDDLGLSPRSRFELGLVAARAVETAGRMGDRNPGLLDPTEQAEYDALCNRVEAARGDLLVLPIRERARLVHLNRKAESDARP